MSKRVDHVKTHYYDTFGKNRLNNPTMNRQIRRENMYIRVLSEIAMNRFKWSGLPNTVDERFLEKVLHENGLAVFFFEDRKFNCFLALRGSPSGQLNMYDNPLEYRVIGNTQINRTVGARHCVPIWGNFSRVADSDIIRIFAEQLATLDRTIEINSYNLRQTKIIVAPENKRLTMHNMNQQVEEGVSTITVTDESLIEAFQVLNVDIDPRSLPALMEARSKIWAQAMLLLGIDNNPNEGKNERVASAEVESNDDQIQHQRSISLNARRQACAVINRRYPGLNVSVDYVTGDNQEFSGMLDDMGIVDGGTQSLESLLKELQS